MALLYFPAFITYLYLGSHSKADHHLPLLMGLAVLLRLSAWPGMPQLSDDVYRFIWDGRLINQGINPFAHLPEYYMELPNPPEGITRTLFGQLNSPAYFTIYPPVAQGVFALACWLFPTSVLGSTLVMKSFLLLCECVTIYCLPRLLNKLNIAPKHALLYALNPLVVVEVVGNLHFEGAMVCFLLLSFWWIYHNRWIASGIAMALSIASKLLPLLFLFFFIRRLGWKKALSYFTVVGISLLLLFAPLLGEAFFNGFGSSLDLYFRRFEFNGSVYYALRALGYQLLGYNLIQYLGPILALGTFIGISTMAIINRRKDWRSIFPQCLFAITLYLAFTTTVHPWYSLLPLFLCVFTRFRYPVFWTGMIFLTYINYSYTPYHENLWIVGLEYLSVAVFGLWEARRSHAMEAA